MQPKNCAPPLKCPRSFYIGLQISCLWPHSSITPRSPWLGAKCHPHLYRRFSQYSFTLSLCAQWEYPPPNITVVHTQQSVPSPPSSNFPTPQPTTFSSTLSVNTPIYRKAFTHIRYILSQSLFKNAHFHYFLPIFPAFPRWTTPSPYYNSKFKWTCKKEITNAWIYRTHLVEILIPTPRHSLLHWKFQN